MQKIIKVDSKVIVMFEDGSYCERNDVSEDLFKQIVDTKDDEEIYTLMCPEYHKRIRDYKNVMNFKEGVEKSNLLVLKNESVYWEEVSPLSIPTELVKAILDAENSNDENRITTYKNFWTLMSLNPDERCRANLFWFLNKNGLVLAKCGFFVAYRNANYHHTEEDGTIVYTDAHTGTTRIKIGEMVTMPREDTDPVQENTCSRGLHCGASWWLKKNYFGNQGLVVLVNPADVVAVPPYDDYGKLRTCAYLPIEKAEFDSEGNVIPFKAEDGFNCSYVTKVIYEGLMGTEIDSTYKIEIPDIPGIDKEGISDQLLDIAMKCITEKMV